MRFSNIYSIIELIYSIYQYLFEELCKKINNKQEDNINNTPTHNINSENNENKDNEDNVVYNEIYRNSVRLDDFENDNIVDRNSLKRISINVNNTKNNNDNNDTIDVNIDKKISFSNIYDVNNNENNDKNNNENKNKEENIFWNNYYQSET